MKVDEKARSVETMLVCSIVSLVIALFCVSCFEFVAAAIMCGVSLLLVAVALLLVGRADE